MLLTLSGCTLGNRPITPLGVVPDAPVLTIQDRRVAEQAKRQMFLNQRLWDNARQRQRVLQITKQLLAQTDTNDQWELFLIDNPAWNAATLHGTIFVFRGLLEDLENDNDLATVLAHEIAHNLARHSEVTAGKIINNLLSAGLAVGAGVLVEKQGGSAEEAQQLASLGKLLGDAAFVKPFSRQDEHEADQIGIFLMADAGFDPAAAPRVWEKKALQGDSAPEFFSTHPASESRYHNLKNLLPQAIPRYEAAKKLARERKLSLYEGVTAVTSVKYPHAADEAARFASQAAQLSEQGRYEEAARLYAEAIKYQPNNIEYLRGLAISLHMLGYHEQAFQLYSRIVQQRPDAVSYYNLACLFAVYDRPSEALSTLQQSLRLDQRLRDLAISDPDFNKIRGYPQFRQIVGY